MRDIRQARGRRHPLLRMVTSAAALLLLGAALTVATPAAPASAAPTLTQVTGFGSNPGSLNMYSYLPTNLPSNAPLVVALHGCTQSASDYYSHSGWSKYADLYGFAIIFAEQPSASNPILNCFDWGTPSNDKRGQGEALSIYQMVQYAEAHWGTNSHRIYITGLSAGAGMTSDMLADYPDVFAAGSIDSGPPAQCSTSGITNTSCTSGTTSHTPAQWGDLARGSDSGYSGPWPRVAIWQGSSDTTVNPAALTENRDQWTNVWGISQTPSSTQSLTGGTTENIYNDGSGNPAVETYSISGMAHGLAVSPGSGTDQCGSTGTYYLSYICSSYYTAKFFGLDQTTPTLPAPTGLAVTGTTNTSVSLSWSAVSGAASYNVYRGGTKVNSSPVTGTSYTDSGLSAGTQYSYTVAAVDSSGAIGAQSAAVNATTTGTQQGLPAPTGLTVTGVTSNSVSLSWGSVSGAASYRVYRGGTLVGSPTGTSYTDTGLTASTGYSYTVAAADSSGAVGALSAAVNATTSAPAQCFTDNNYNQTVAGRAHQSLGYVYANGSNQAMGLWNVYTVHTLKETAPNYYVISDGGC